jgi:hypothetical protein
MIFAALVARKPLEIALRRFDATQGDFSLGIQSGAYSFVGH